MKKLRIYLSSTYEDLKEYRAAVFTALEKAGLDVARMEAYTAADERPVDLCLQDVASSDIYVGLYAWRYGYEPPMSHGNPDLKSITELEYRKAEEARLRKLLFFAHPDTRAHWPDRFRDDVTGEGERGAKLTALRGELGTEKTASFFRTPDELATLVLASIMRSGVSGRVYNVPRRPSEFVPRPDLTKALVDALLGSEVTEEAHVLVQGAGGFGKTALTIDTCHQAEVVNAFPDGILWVVLGEKPDLGKQLSDAHVLVTGSPPAVAGVDGIAEALAKALERRRCLVVVDDVWRADDLAYFLKLNGQRVVVTTRIRNLLEQSGQTGWLEVPIDEMKASEAAALLGRGLPVDGVIQEALSALAERMGCWPLLLDLANARLLEEYKSRRGNLAECINRVVTLFERRGVVGFDRRDSKARNAAVATSIDVGLELGEEMFTGLAEMASELAIFPEDLEIPVHVLARLWTMDQLIVEEDVLRPLDSLSILRWHRDGDVVQLHDMIRRALERRLADPTAVHRKLLAAYRQYTNGNWADLMDDGYIFNHLAWHFEKAELPEELHGLMNRRWLDARAARSGSHGPFCEDALRLLQFARRRSPQDVADVARCALALSTLGQLTTDAPLELISLYARVAGSSAAGYVATCQDERKRCTAYALLSSALIERKEFVEATDALDHALNIGEHVSLSDEELTALRNAMIAFVDSGMRDEAAAAVRRLFTAHGKQMQPGRYDAGVSFISLFSRLDMMDVLNQTPPSKELARELARAGEVDRAVRVAEAVEAEFPHLQAEALAEVAVAAAEAGFDARGRAIAKRVIQITKTLDPHALNMISDSIARLGRIGLERDVLEVARKLDHKDFVLSDLSQMLIQAKRFAAAGECIAAIEGIHLKAQRLRDLTIALIAENDELGAEGAAREALNTAVTAHEHSPSVYVATAYGCAADALAAVSDFPDAIRAVDQMEQIAQFWEKDESVQNQRGYQFESVIRAERDRVLANIARRLVSAGREAELPEIIRRATADGLAQVVESAAETLIETKGVDAGLRLIRERGWHLTPHLYALIAFKLACAGRFDEVFQRWSDFTNTAGQSDLIRLGTEFLRAQRVERAAELFRRAIDRRPNTEHGVYQIDPWIVDLVETATRAGSEASAAMFVRLAQQTDVKETSSLAVAALGGALILCREIAAAQQLLRAALTRVDNVPDRALAKHMIALYEQALASTAPIQIAPTLPAREEWTPPSAEELRLAIDRGELDEALELASSQNPHTIHDLLSELAAKYLIAGRDDDAMRVTRLVYDFGEGLSIWLEALVGARRLPSALQTLQGYSKDIALPALGELIAAAQEPQDVEVLLDALSYAAGINELPLMAEALARAFDRVGSVEGLKELLDHSRSFGVKGLIETARCLLIRGDESGVQMLPQAIAELKEKSLTIPQDEGEYRAAPWDRQQESDRIVADLFELGDFLFECGRSDEGRELAGFIASLVRTRSIGTELTKASLLLRKAGRAEAASEMFVSALERSWPKGRRATLETLTAGVHVYVGDERGMLKQVYEAVRDVESWW